MSNSWSDAFAPCLLQTGLDMIRNYSSCDGSSSPQRGQYCIGAREGRSSTLTVTFRPQFSHSIFVMTLSYSRSDTTDVIESTTSCGVKIHNILPDH